MQQSIALHFRVQETATNRITCNFISNIRGTLGSGGGGRNNFIASSSSSSSKVNLFIAHLSHITNRVASGLDVCVGGGRKESTFGASQFISFDVWPNKQRRRRGRRLSKRIQLSTTQYKKSFAGNEETEKRKFVSCRLPIQMLSSRPLSVK